MNQSNRADAIHQAAGTYASATASDAQPDLFEPLTFLLAQVRKALGMDVVFVSRFSDTQRVFEVVSAEGELSEIAPGVSDPLLQTYCHRVAQGRLPAVIPDTGESAEASSLAITQRLNIRAYLSAAVVLANGRVFGTVCCISHQPRSDLVEADAKALKAVAQAVAASVDRKGRVRFASWTSQPEGSQP